MFFYLIIHYTRYSIFYLYFFYFVFTIYRPSVTMSRTPGSTSSPSSSWVEKLPTSSPPYNRTYTPVLSSIEEEEEDTSDPLSLLLEAIEFVSRTSDSTTSDPSSPWEEKLPSSSPPYNSTYTPVLSSIEEEEEEDEEGIYYPFSLLLQAAEMVRLFDNTEIDDGEEPESKLNFYFHPSDSIVNSSSVYNEPHPQLP
jgi:hypothetical protein